MLKYNVNIENIYINYINYIRISNKVNLNHFFVLKKALKINNKLIKVKKK